MMIKNNNNIILKLLSLGLFLSLIFTLAACNSDGVVDNPEDEIPNESVDFNASLTGLEINGTSIMGFDTDTLEYIIVLSLGETETPSVEAIPYSSEATVSITEASDINSEVESSRTSVVTVTSDEGEVVIYNILFNVSNLETIDLHSAEDFVILAESGISSETSSLVTGDIGVSPQAATYITGFSLTKDSLGAFSTSAQVVGNVYASDYTSPTPSVLTTAIADMHTAYTDASTHDANYTELYSGDLSGKTLTTGVYKFSTGILINTDLTLKGSATDLWVFQINGALTQAANINIILSDGALAENIFWQVADTVTLGTGAHFEGIILGMTNITLGTNATLNGRLFAQTAVTLDAATVTKPE